MNLGDFDKIVKSIAEKIVRLEKSRIELSSILRQAKDHVSFEMVPDRQERL